MTLIYYFIWRYNHSMTLNYWERESNKDLFHYVIMWTIGIDFLIVVYVLFEVFKLWI